MIDHPYKELFYQPSIDKQWLITGDGINFTNSDIESNSITLTESLCSQERLMFGSCESSMFEFTVHGVNQSLKGKTITVTLILNGDIEHAFPVGTYKIYRDTPSADRKLRKVAACDALYFINNDDVTYWYDHLTFPISIKNFRDSFFNHFETSIEQEIVTLPNDNVMIKKTIDVNINTSISGNTIISAICELNGCFGHIGRDGKFHYVYLNEIIEGLYPAEDLYPADDLYPKEDAVGQIINMGMYRQIDYEDYECYAIDNVMVVNDEGKLLATIGTGDNTYVFDNVLIYDKNATQITSIINNIFNHLRVPKYWPCEIECIGNLCLEVGDSLRLNTSSRLFYTYILQRTLTGTQSLKDDFIAEGEEIRTERLNSVSAELTESRALAGDAKQSANQASSAASSASSAASSAQTSANQASQAASNAQGTADSALSQAQAAANQASSAASQAQSAAQQASSAASQASSAATTAQQAANTATSAYNSVNGGAVNAQSYKYSPNGPGGRTLQLSLITAKNASGQTCYVLGTYTSP